MLAIAFPYVKINLAETMIRKCAGSQSTYGVRSPASRCVESTFQGFRIAGRQ